MNILAIDTSTKGGSLALSCNDRIISETLLNVEVTHSETLLPAVKKILNDAGISLADIGLFALTIGPGSFTGVRIGVSTIKGFAFALEKPIAGVSTIEAMAHNFADTELTITPVLDARRGEFYTADFRWNKLEIERLSEDRAVSPETLTNTDREKTIFVGDGLTKLGKHLKERFGDMAILAPPSESYLKGSVIASLALKKYGIGETLDPASFTPTYLRRSEAEINREKGLLRGC
ncbi:MAG: tRNA (adenosine(37)-N6)-threonylcarbamoyltransferase complex dimerization subunit type 1 TsaB [Proteobacteria bacterium]|nr:tRNA (adenosine(37)-N6)-threonylcarbamoyltransferase complex dimerization subunit type 1 TsaB [Pseudomonadota bacterium]